MPAPPGFNPLFNCPVELSLNAQGAGTYTSEILFGNNPNSFPISDVELWLWVSDIEGTANVNCALESSPDGSVWALVPGSTTPELPVPGNATANASAPPGTYLRVTSTVAGTGTVTCRVLPVVALAGD